MGGTVLEFFRMMVYVTFPLGIYYVTNSPNYFGEQRKPPDINSEEYKEQQKRKEKIAADLALIEEFRQQRALREAQLEEEES